MSVTLHTLGLVAALLVLLIGLGALVLALMEEAQVAGDLLTSLLLLALLIAWPFTSATVRPRR